MPVDRASRVVLELMFHQRPIELVYHLENPTRQPWSEMCTVLENELTIPMKQRLDFREWLRRVAVRADAVPDLMDFLEDHFLHMSGANLNLNMRHSLASSQTLRFSGSVRFDTVKLYLGFWRQRGFLK